MSFALTILALVVVLAIAWRFLGGYMAAVFDGRVSWLRFAERPAYRIIGVDPDAEQSWQRYGVSLVMFSAVALGLTYAIFRLQEYLPFNPQHLGAVGPATRPRRSTPRRPPRPPPAASTRPRTPTRRWAASRCSPG
jgi:potassium-transporting ATPase potassium-binding subunit